MGINYEVVDDDENLPKNPNMRRQPKQYLENMSNGLNVSQILAIIVAVGLICGGIIFLTDKPCPDMTCAQANLSCPEIPSMTCEAAIIPDCSQTIIIPSLNYTNGTCYNITTMPSNMLITLMNTTNSTLNVTNVANYTSGYYKTIALNISGIIANDSIIYVRVE